MKAYQKPISTVHDIALGTLLDTLSQDTGPDTPIKDDGGILDAPRISDELYTGIHRHHSLWDRQLK